MASYKPLESWRGKHRNESGKIPMVFNAKLAAEPDNPIQLPCGRCIGCRIDRSKQWAIRCHHEAQMHEENCFITLTFAPGELEKRKNPWSVDVRDYQLFMKKLRNKYPGKTIRYFHCGEYGENAGRPHYHACLFGFDFEDKKLWSIKNGNRLYTSSILEELWPYGFSTIGEVTFQSAAYVARYIMKKVTGEQAEEHYQVVQEETGEISTINPEYTTMSRRPGIGSTWLQKFHQDVYPSDSVVIDGKQMKPPKYYDKQIAEFKPFEFEHIQDLRKIKAMKYSEHGTDERLRVREKLQQRKLEKLKRSHDEIQDI